MALDKTAVEPASQRTMTTISKDAKLVTFINVFTVEPANQQRLVDLLARFTDASVRHAPGFVSAALHRSLDGTKVTMFEPGMYEVVETYLRRRGYLSQFTRADLRCIRRSGCEGEMVRGPARQHGA
jgi:quinol monooxygenase YgiN